jgi:diadenosine tetraphosphatase ApaH/serine/threonine PP2A family protein phosphatase
VDLFSIAKETQNAQAEDFLQLTENTINVLKGEHGRIGNITVSDRLVKIEAVGEALVIGDLHGDIDSLVAILERSEFIMRMQQKRDSTLVFLGDYGDRGPYSTEVYYVVMSLKLAFPEQVILLRGNHEGPSDLLATPHDLPQQLQARFREKWIAVESKLHEFFTWLHNAVVVEGKYLMVHGGLPSKIRSLEEIALADKMHPQKPFLEDLLWSDPDENVRGTYPSPRGAGNLFDKIITADVLAKLNVKLLIRGHEPCPEGFKVNHDGKVLTLFSRKGFPYFNSHGAYLDFPLSEEFENAHQLLLYIHKF